MKTLSPPERPHVKTDFGQIGAVRDVLVLPSRAHVGGGLSTRCAWPGAMACRCRGWSVVMPSGCASVDSMTLGQPLSKALSCAVAIYALSPESDFSGLFLPLEVLPSLRRKGSPQQTDLPKPGSHRELFQCS